MKPARRFAWRLWFHTGPTESLFDLNRTELAMFRQFVRLANDHP